MHAHDNKLHHARALCVEHDLMVRCSYCFIEQLSLHYCTQAISHAQDAHAYVHVCIYSTYMLLICRWFTCMGCCSILMPLLLSGYYMHSCWRNTQAALGHRKTRRRMVKPFRSDVSSSAKGLKYILLKNNFWDDQQRWGVYINYHLMRFLGRVH